MSSSTDVVNVDVAQAPNVASIAVIGRHRPPVPAPPPPPQTGEASKNLQSR